MSAQLENGYTRIANEILDHMCQTKLNGSQFRICMAIWRFTYGFNRKEFPISIKSISEATGINKRQVQRELNALVAAHIVLVVEEATFSSPATLAFNKYFDQWCLDRQEVTNKTPGSERDTSPDGELVTPPGVGLDVTPDGELDTPLNLGDQQGPDLEDVFFEAKDNIKDNIKDNSKENIYSLQVQKIFSTWNAQKIIIHQEITPDMDKAIAKAVKRYNIEGVLTAIVHYGEVYRDELYYFDYKWSLTKFLTQKNALPDFMDDGVKWLNYIQEKRAGPVKTSVAAQNKKVLEAVFGGETGSA